MAQDLGISEGVAGQSVTVTAFVAMFASLFITQTIQATDRRYVVILFAVLLTLSCLLVSFANSFSLLLIGRACLGLALGGFWAMSASLTMRLVPPRTVPKALSVIFGAVSIALVIAAPLGSFLGELIGWRNVFNAAAVMGVLCIFWIIKSLPSLPGEPSHQKQNTFRLLQRPGVMAGMIAIFMSFAGQFAFFTYIRPVYMNLAGFGVDGLTLVLLSFGIASFIGTSLSSFILKRSVKLALAGAPLILAVSALVLTLWGSDKIVATGVAIIWGLTFALVPVGWSTWITRSLADQAEKAGSIQVAVIQLANTCGAAIGGYALDNIGLTSPLMLSATMASRICCLLFSSDNINFSHASSDNDACGVQILRKSCNTVVFSFADCSELKGDSAYTMPGIAKKVKISSSVVGFMDSTFYKCVSNEA